MPKEFSILILNKNKNLLAKAIALAENQECDRPGLSIFRDRAIS